eukprot:TRINITY_DN992_c0_g4_i4.p1 TRINITY_DN992_c0_g4~~TRINITY_DN992_c0_g4_i4.p1  ORF type:complete len:783 (+),score=136.83 TRINITY_DN992_c0_g4_i4:773-3121(+)
MGDPFENDQEDLGDSKTILHVVNTKGRSELKRTAGGDLVYVRADGTQIVKKEGKEEGDWSCGKCGTVNWGSKKRLECYKCKERRDDDDDAAKRAVSELEEYRKQLMKSLDRSLVESPQTTTPIASPKKTFKHKKRTHPTLKLGMGITPLTTLPANPQPITTDEPTKPEKPAENSNQSSPVSAVEHCKPNGGAAVTTTITTTAQQPGRKNVFFMDRQLSIINQVTSGSAVWKVKAQVDNQIRTAVHGPSSSRKQMKSLKPIKKASDLELQDLCIDERDSLGAGAYGRVYKCWVKADEIQAKKDGRMFPKPSDIKAIKVMNLDQAGCREDYEKNATAARNELKTWIAVTGGMLDDSSHKRLRSTHVVIPLRPFESDHDFKILMDFMHFGSLDDLMLAISRIPADEVQSMVTMISQGGPDPLDRLQIPEKDGPTTPPAHPESLTPLPEPALSYVMEMVLKGLEFLHDLKLDGQTVNMVHQDIKPGNILIDNWAMVKIADFGLAGFMNAGLGGGTRLYMPPEMATNKEMTQAADLWSLGVSAMECALGLHSLSSEHLFSASATSSYLISRDFDPDENTVREHVSWDSVLQTIQANDRLRSTWNKLSEPFKDFCENCLTFNPMERPPAKALKDHQFIVGRSRWKRPEMKAFLDTLIQRLITQDRLTGGNSEAQKWESRGWQIAKQNTTAATECSSSTQSSVPLYFSSAMQRRRKMWMGSWRGRGRGQPRGSVPAARGPSRNPHFPPSQPPTTTKSAQPDPIEPPKLLPPAKPPPTAVQNDEKDNNGG